MMWSELPPAGDAIVLRRDAGLQEPAWPVRFYASGTAALAAALAAVVRRHGGRRPRVILPAYACPALVSAAVWAGASPLYADLEPERPWLSLAEVERLLGPETAAVVAVNFLGIPERLAELGRLAAARGAVLIDDSAQAFPEGPRQAALTVLSFGRGKPVSLLGGGAVLAVDEELLAELPAPPPAPARPRVLRLTVTAYNLLRRPSLYWLPRRLPLALGETRYHALERLLGMDAARRAALPAAIAAHRRASAATQGSVREAVAGSALLDLAQVCCAEHRRLSRYPLLAPDQSSRDALLGKLAALGGSSLYGRILPELPGVPTAAAGSAGLPAAREFASRLITLPVHDAVSPRHVGAMRALLHEHRTVPLVRAYPKYEETP